MKHIVYRITNTKTLNVYIGQTSNLVTRKYVHKNCLVHGKHRSKLMQNDFHLFGWDSFNFDIIDSFENQNEAMLCEYNTIKNENPKYNTYKNKNQFSKEATCVIAIRVPLAKKKYIKMEIKKLVRLILKKSI